MEPGRSLLDYKGSDVMVRGLGIFYRETGVRLDIRLVSKGLHVAELELLIADEGLIEHVTWLDEMPLAKVWEEFAQCDIVFEQLGDSMIGMAGLDAMASGRPVIGNARPEISTLFSRPESPICQAQTPEEVCAQLKRLVFNPAERERLGLMGRRYVEEHFSPLRAAQTCLQRFQMALQPGPAKIDSADSDHSFYSRLHEQYLHALQSSQLELADTRSKLLSLQSEMARYRSSPLVQLARKLRLV